MVTGHDVVMEQIIVDVCFYTFSPMVSVTYRCVSIHLRTEKIFGDILICIYIA